MKHIHVLRFNALLGRRDKVGVFKGTLTELYQALTTHSRASAYIGCWLFFISDRPCNVQ